MSLTERMARIELINLEQRRIQVETVQATERGNLDHVRALRHEMEVLYRSALELRREQLKEQIDPPKAHPKSRRWGLPKRQRRTA